MTNDILKYISCVFTFILLYWGATIFFEEKRKSFLLRAVSVVICASILAFANSFSNPLINTIISIALHQIMLHVFFKGKIIEKSIFAVLAFAIALACEFITVAIASSRSDVGINEFSDISLNKASYNLISIFLFCIILLITRQLVYKRKTKHGLYSFRPNKYVLILPVVSIFILYYVFFVDAVISDSNTINNLNVLVIVGILTTNVMVLAADHNSYKAYEMEMHQAELEYQEKINEMNEKIIIQQSNNIEQLEIVVHDFKHHISALENQVVSTYGSNILEKDFEEISDITICNMPQYRYSSKALTAIINDYAMKCNENNIVFIPEITYDNLNFIAFPDICSLLSNALDNAFCSAVNGDSDNFIKISISKIRKMLTIEIENTVNSKIEMNEDGYLSTKHDGKRHGIGLKNMKAITKKYFGNILIYHEGNMFYVKILIPIDDNYQNPQP